MATVSSTLLVAAAVFQMVACGNAWYYQSSNSQPSNQLLSKHQFLLPPYPSYQHELLHQAQSSHLGVHDNRFYGNPGEFAEPTSYNELSFEGPYEVTAPRVPGLYFRLSSGVFVPVKAVYSFPPFLERIVQRIQGYYSVYNPPEALGLERPVPGGGVPLPPTLEVLPVLPPHHIPPSPVPGFNPELGPKPEGPNPPPSPEPEPSPEPQPESSPESPDNESNEPSSTEQTETVSTSTTESTREETTPPGEISSATDSLELLTDSPVEDTTTS